MSSHTLVLVSLTGQKKTTESRGGRMVQLGTMRPQIFCRKIFSSSLALSPLGRLQYALLND